jgi:OPA family glycerol-3-phosphate transporter-like MFS transporter
MNSVKNKNKNIRATVLFAVCFFAYMTSYIGRNTFAALLTSMSGEGIIERDLAGTVATAYMLAYGIGQIVFGRLSQRVSPTVLMPLGLVGSGLANVGMAFSTSYAACLVLWGLCGAFNAMLWPSLTRAFAEWLPDDRKQSAGVNISLTIPFGSVISLLLCSLLLGVFSWKTCYIVCGLIVTLSGAISMIGFFSIREYISERKQMFFDELSKKEGTVKAKFPARTLFGTLAILMIPVAMINGALKDSITSWAPTIVEDTFLTEPTFSSLVSVMLPIVSVSGAYVAKFVDKYVRNESRTAAILFGVVTACHVTLFFAGTSNVWLTVVLLAVSVAATWGVNTMIISLFPLRFAKIGASGAVSGVLNSGNCLFSGLMSTVYGLMSSSLGWTSVYMLCAIFGVLAVVAAIVSSKATAKISY